MKKPNLRTIITASLLVLIIVISSVAAFYLHFSKPDEPAVTSAGNNIEPVDNSSTPDTVEEDNNTILNVLTEGEKSLVKVKFEKMIKINSKRSFTVDYTITDYMGQQVDSGSEKIEIDAGKDVIANITPRNAFKKGKYDMNVVLKSKDTVMDRKNLSFVIVDGREARLAHDSPFAIGSYGGFLGSRFDEQKLAETYGMMEKAGIKWTREEIFWSELRPSKDGPYKWEKFDRTVIEARKHGIHIMGLLDYWAGWSVPYENDPNHIDWDSAIANFKQYSKDIVKRYMPGGDLAKEQGWDDGYGITSWEVWNEPPTYWFGTAEQFGRLVKAASEGIRSTDPQAFIVVSNQDETFDKTVLDVAGTDAYDALAIHLYPGAISPDGARYQKIVKDERAFLDRNGAADKAIWITETGWNTMGQVTELQQANNIVCANILTIAAGVDKVFIFTFNYNNPSESWGLVEQDLKPKVSYAAYAAMTGRLEGKKFTADVNMGSSIRSFVFSDEKVSTAALWTLKDTATLSIDPDPGIVFNVYDFFGNLIGQHSEPFEVELSESPVYIEADGIKGEALAERLRNGNIVGMDTVKIDVGYISQVPADGAHPVIDVAIANSINTEQKGIASIELPEGWKAKNKAVSFDNLQPGGSEKVSFEVTEFRKNEDGVYPVEVRVQTDKGRTAKTCSLFLPAAQRFAPSLDGKDGDWAGQLKVHLNTPDKVVGIAGWTPENLSAVASTAWDDDYFYLNAAVTDDMHSQPHNDWYIWEGDSIQIFFDTKNDKSEASVADDMQFGAALSDSGEVVFINYSTNQKTDVIKGKITRDEAAKKTNYEIAVPWSELKLKPEEGMKMGFNFMINDNDGTGRNGWINLKDGIGNSYLPQRWPGWELTGEVKQSVVMGGQQVFEDDFSSINPAWTVMGGTFEVKDGYAYAHSDGATHHDRNMSYAFIDDMPENCIVTTKFIVDRINVKGESRVGIVAKCADDGSEGGFKWDAVLWSTDGLYYYQEDGGWPGQYAFKNELSKVYNLKADIDGTSVKSKVWVDGTAEPSEWQISSKFSSIQEEDGLGLYYAAADVRFFEFRVEAKNSR